MTYIDTSPREVAVRAARTMYNKHRAHINQHEAQFGKLGQHQTKAQKARLKKALTS